MGLFGPSADQVIARGAPASGRILGIQVRWSGDEPRERFERYALEVGGRTLGVQQSLEPYDEVRLGMTVPLRLDGETAVIEWGESTRHWKGRIDAPAAGIDDDHDAEGNRAGLSTARRGRAVTATVLEIAERRVMMIARTLDLRVRVEGGAEGSYEITIGKAEAIPGYASHLPVVGAMLPAWETSSFLGGRSVVIDWPAAAEADPGVGRPAARPRDTVDAGELLGSGLAAMGIEESAAAPGPTGPNGSWTAEEPPEIPEYAKKLMRRMGVDPDALGKGPGA